MNREVDIKIKFLMLIFIILILLQNCIYEAPKARDIGSHMTQKILLIENDTDLCVRLGYKGLPYLPDMEFRRYINQRTRGLNVINIRYLYTRDMTQKIYIYEAVVYLRK